MRLVYPAGRDPELSDNDELRRSPDILFAVATLCGLGLCLLGLGGVHGFITDLLGGTTTTGHASDIVRRATNPGRYWGLMAVWLRELL
jgi:hypothetical protein